MRTSNPKLHQNQLFACGPLILTFARVPAETGCEFRKTFYNSTGIGEHPFAMTTPRKYGSTPMKLSRRKLLGLAACAAALPGAPHAVWAQAYPARPIRAVVPFAPGGTTDTFARLMAQKLTQQLGKQVYVENIAGATGNVGTGQVAKSAPDGYTILFAFSSYVVNPTLFARLPYDPVNDFRPVTLAVASTTVLTINPAVPAKTVKELVELIKANPGKYSFSSAGAGTQAHLAGEQFRLSLGLDLVHVPFGGGGPAVAAVVAGHTPMSFGSPQAAMQHVKE